LKRTLPDILVLIAVEMSLRAHALGPAPLVFATKQQQHLKLLQVSQKLLKNCLCLLAPPPNLRIDNLIISYIIRTCVLSPERRRRARYAPFAKHPDVLQRGPFREGVRG
jgi:hypothetical protein